MTTPVMRAVESSYLKKVGYDPDEEELYVEFPGGKVWRYANITAQHYAELLAAESIGKFFIATIKKRPSEYPGEPVQ